MNTCDTNDGDIEQGFSLIELLVALTIGAVIVPPLLQRKASRQSASIGTIVSGNAREWLHCIDGFSQ